MIITKNLEHYLNLTSETKKTKTKNKKILSRKVSKSTVIFNCQLSKLKQSGGLIPNKVKNKTTLILSL